MASLAFVVAVRTGPSERSQRYSDKAGLSRFQSFISEAEILKITQGRRFDE